MDWSRISRYEWIGIGCALVALISLFLTPWYSLTDTPERATQNAWLCGTDDFSCTGWETFPYLRWALLLGVAAPLILAYILARGHKLSWAPGEMTMIAASVGLVLIAYNGIIDTPAPDDGTEFGISTDWGYWIAVLAGVGMVVTAFLRSQESGGRQQRKAPGTV